MPDKVNSLFSVVRKQMKYIWDDTDSGVSSEEEVCTNSSRGSALFNDKDNFSSFLQWNTYILLSSSVFGLLQWDNKLKLQMYNQKASRGLYK